MEHLPPPCGKELLAVGLRRCARQEKATATELFDGRALTHGRTRAPANGPATAAPCNSGHHGSVSLKSEGKEDGSG
jgi:hypothetical protein